MPYDKNKPCQVKMREWISQREQLLAKPVATRTPDEECEIWHLTNRIDYWKYHDAVKCKCAYYGYMKDQAKTGRPQKKEKIRLERPGETVPVR